MFDTPLSVSDRPEPLRTPQPEEFFGPSPDLAVPSDGLPFPEDFDLPSLDNYPISLVSPEFFDRTPSTDPVTYKTNEPEIFFVGEVTEPSTDNSFPANDLDFGENFDQFLCATSSGPKWDQMGQVVYRMGDWYPNGSTPQELCNGDCSAISETGQSACSNQCKYQIDYGQASSSQQYYSERKNGKDGSSRKVGKRSAPGKIKTKDEEEKLSRNRAAVQRHRQNIKDKIATLPEEIFGLEKMNKLREKEVLEWKKKYAHLLKTLLKSFLPKEVKQGIQNLI